MEIVKYEEPESWEDKGMDWNVPDPRNADYAMAIRGALMERCAAAHVPLPSGVASISPWKPVSVAQVKSAVAAVSRIAGNFLNRDFDAYKDDWSDFPRMWTYRDLVREDGCRLFEFAKAGDLCEGGGEWLKRIRNAIDKLTAVKCPGAWGVARTRSGSRHDPPFGESIGDAFEEAFDDERGLHAAKFAKAPSQVYAWSGNTHWKCPDPDGDPDDENNVDGYCGYAQSVAYEFGKVRSWVAGRELDLVAYALVDAPTGPVPYSTELETSVFDAGESGFRKGLNVRTAHVKDPSDVSFGIGNADSIPRNGAVPTSDFDENGTATLRRSAKRGYAGKLWLFQDYGCENGFRFRRKEG